MKITQRMVTLSETSYHVVGRRQGSDSLYKASMDFTSLSDALEYIQWLRDTPLPLLEDTYAIVEMKPILMEL